MANIKTESLEIITKDGDTLFVGLHSDYVSICSGDGEAPWLDLELVIRLRDCLSAWIERQ